MVGNPRHSHVIYGRLGNSWRRCRVCCLMVMPWIAFDGSLLIIGVTCYVCLYHWLVSVFIIG